MTDKDALTTAALEMVKTMIATGQAAFETQIGPVQHGNTSHGVWRVKVERVE